MTIRTYKQFIKVLSRVSVNWNLVNLADRNLIRTTVTRRAQFIGGPDACIKVCPICAVSNAKIGVDIFSTDASSACEAAGIQMTDAMFQRIIMTADGCGTKEDTALMLAACGLKGGVRI